jgi:ribosomal protein L37AE/L43A
MKGYDVVCPICGTLNKNLNLEETDGWMECEKCQHTVGIPQFMHRVKVPVYTPEQLARIAKRPANIGKVAFGRVVG